MWPGDCATEDSGAAICHQHAHIDTSLPLVYPHINTHALYKNTHLESCCWVVAIRVWGPVLWVGSHTPLCCGTTRVHPEGLNRHGPGCHHDSARRHCSSSCSSGRRHGRCRAARRGCSTAAVGSRACCCCCGCRCGRHAGVAATAAAATSIPSCRPVLLASIASPRGVFRGGRGSQGCSAYRCCSGLPATILLVLRRHLLLLLLLAVAASGPRQLSMQLLTWHGVPWGLRWMWPLSTATIPSLIRGRHAALPLQPVAAVATIPALPAAIRALALVKPWPTEAPVKPSPLHPPIS